MTEPAATAEAEAGGKLLLSVVIPVYNEIKTLETVIGRVRDVPIAK